MPGRRTAFNHSLSALTISPQTFATSGATATGTTVDLRRRGVTDDKLQSFRTAMLIAVVGGVDAGTHAFKLQHSDDDSTWEDVSADDLQGSNISVTTAEADSALDQGYIGFKRFLRAHLTVGTFAAGQDAQLGAVILRDSVESPPVDR